MKTRFPIFVACSILSGCAQFMVPTEVTELYTAAERDAFYSMVNEGVATSAAGLTLFYLATRISERLPSEETMRTKWVPQGVRAYAKDNYVNSQDERQNWQFMGLGTYDATFSRNNNRRLFQPAANLAYFCSVSGGSFKLKHPDKTSFIDPYSLRPDDRYQYELNHTGPDPYLKAAPLFPIRDAQKYGAWGLFTCTNPDGKQTWWAKITPSNTAKPIFGSVWSMPISVMVYETPLEANPGASMASVDAGLNSVIQQAFRTSMSSKVEHGDVVLEAWPGDRSKDRWGCREILGTATYGDRIVTNRRKMVCPST